MRILVAEDERDIQKLIRMTLEFAGGHQVTVVENGQEALDAATEDPPDLILLDVMMPVMDGIETLRHLKANEATAQTPVIFLTAKAQTSEVELGLESGAIGYITKPFDAKVLNDQIDALLASGETADHSS